MTSKQKNTEKNESNKQVISEAPDGYSCDGNCASCSYGGTARCPKGM